MIPPSLNFGLKAISYPTIVLGMLMTPLLVSGSAMPNSVTRAPLFINRVSPDIIYSVTEPQWATPGREEMKKIANNVIDKNRALKCKPLLPDVICDRIEWFTKKEIRGDETWAKALTRLVQYKIFQQSITGDANQATFEAILDTIRVINDNIAEPSSLVGENPRVLDALDPILNDVCDQTGSSKVDRRLQEIVDIVQVGLRTPLPPHQAFSTPPPCQCRVKSHPSNVTVCIKEAALSWNPDQVGGWECNCIEGDCVPGK